MFSESEQAWLIFLVFSDHAGGDALIFNLPDCVKTLWPAGDQKKVYCYPLAGSNHLGNLQCSIPPTFVKENLEELNESLDTKFGCQSTWVDGGPIQFYQGISNQIRKSEAKLEFSKGYHSASAATPRPVGGRLADSEKWRKRRDYLKNSEGFRTFADQIEAAKTQATNHARVEVSFTLKIGQYPAEARNMQYV